MSKVITSPVKKWPGTVTLADPLSFPQYLAWRDALRAARDYLTEAGDAAQQDEYDLRLLPGIVGCVEKWGLTDFNPNPFPATPRIASAKLIVWLVNEMAAIVNEADDVPND